MPMLMPVRLILDASAIKWSPTIRTIGSVVRAECPAFCTINQSYFLLVYLFRRQVLIKFAVNKILVSKFAR